MPTIDADAHVLECEETWEYVEPSAQQYRPVAVATVSSWAGQPDDTASLG